jgi:ribosomal protein S1
VQQVAPAAAGPEVQQRLVWEELRAAMQATRPVQGRVLNACTGGYAVGVAGYVAFLPFRAASAAVARRIGVLQPFLVARVNEAQRLVVLADVESRSRAPSVRVDKMYSNV